MSSDLPGQEKSPGALIPKGFQDVPGKLRHVLGSVDGGDEEDRTPDLRIANATLSQLSYAPKTIQNSSAAPPVDRRKRITTALRFIPIGCARSIASFYLLD
jgi:hypothetical protein